jgi:hypothetical protein
MRHEQEANVKASDGFRVQPNALRCGQGNGTSAVEGAMALAATGTRSGCRGRSDFLRQDEEPEGRQVQMRDGASMGS